MSFLDCYRCRRSRVSYGAQAMLVRRALFERIGGFPDQPNLEDVAFCEKLIRVITPVLLSPPVLTDSRKFRKMGVWRSFARVLLIILRGDRQHEMQEASCPRRDNLSGIQIPWQNGRFAISFILINGQDAPGAPEHG